MGCLLFCCIWFLGKEDEVKMLMKRVHIVDDAAFMRMALKTMLERMELRH